MKPRAGFFEKISKIDKPLARLTKKKREGTQVNKIRNESRDTITKNHKRILQTNWTTWKKWTNFEKHTICQD